MSCTPKEGFRPSSPVAAVTLICLLAAPWLAGCAADGAGDRQVLATIDGEPIELADLDELIGDQLSQMDMQYRTQRQQLIEAALDRVIRDRLLEAEAV